MWINTGVCFTYPSKILPLRKSSKTAVKWEKNCQNTYLVFFDFALASFFGVEVCMSVQVFLFFDGVFIRNIECWYIVEFLNWH